MKKLYLVLAIIGAIVPYILYKSLKRDCYEAPQFNR